MALYMNEHHEFVDHEPVPCNPYAKYAALKPAISERPKPPVKDYDGAVCEECGAVYTAHKATQKYCSDECRARAGERRRRERRLAGGAMGAVLALALLLPATAYAVPVLDVVDHPAPLASGRVAHGIGAVDLGAVDSAADAAQEPQDADDGAMAGAVDQMPEYEQSGAQDSATQSDGYSGYVAEYSELYNTDGPSRTMPGWHEGYLETYYNASAHYLAPTWSVDSEGFYRDSDGRYVVGVDIADTNPSTGEPYAIGDVVDTGRGEAVVMDYGSGARVHDFATVW